MHWTLRPPIYLMPVPGACCHFPFGGAFHTPLMAPAATRLSGALSRMQWQLMSVPVVSSVDARPHVDAVRALR